MKKSNKLLLFWLFFIVLGLFAAVTYPSKLAYILILLLFFLAIPFKGVFGFINKHVESVPELFNSIFLVKLITVFYFIVVIVLFVFFEYKPNNPVSGLLTLMAPFLFILVLSQVRLFVKYRKNNE